MSYSTSKGVLAHFPFCINGLCDSHLSLCEHSHNPTTPGAPRLDTGGALPTQQGLALHSREPERQSCLPSACHTATSMQRMPRSYTRILLSYDKNRAALRSAVRAA